MTEQEFLAKIAELRTQCLLSPDICFRYRCPSCASGMHLWTGRHTGKVTLLGRRLSCHTCMHYPWFDTLEELDKHYFGSSLEKAA